MVGWANMGCLPYVRGNKTKVRSRLAYFRWADNIFATDCSGCLFFLDSDALASRVSKSVSPESLARRDAGWLDACDRGAESDDDVRAAWAASTAAGVACPTARQTRS